MSRTPDRWQALEARVAAHFAGHGYATERNAVREGRSGGSHEVDVLAEKADALTTYRVAVECKAWSGPVGKEAVVKLDHVVRDLGLSKGIVVSIAGFHEGARVAAHHAGIDLWGRDEVRHHLGPTVDGPVRGSPTAVGLGLPPRMGAATGARFLRQAAAGGVAGIGRERIAWSAMAWLPAYELQIAVSLTAGRVHRRIIVERRWNLFEALTGSLVGLGTSPAPTQEISLGGACIQPLLRDARVAATVRKAFGRYESVTSETARTRHAATLAEMGVPASSRSVDVEEIRSLYLPFYVGLLVRRARQRLVAIDCVSKAVVGRVTEAVNANLHHVERCLAPRPDRLSDPTA